MYFFNHAKTENSPDKTAVGEIKVPPQKNDGGFVCVSINATIQGKSPRVKLCPLTISPVRRLGIPQLLTLLRDRLNWLVLAIEPIASTQIRIKKFRCIPKVSWSTVKLYSRVNRKLHPLCGTLIARFSRLQRTSHFQGFYYTLRRTNYHVFSQMRKN